MNAPRRAWRDGSTLSLLLVMAVMLLVCVAATQMATAKLRLLPLALGITVLLLAGLQLARELRAPPSAARRSEVETEMSLPAVGAWLGGLFLGVYLAGFMLSIPLFLVAYMRARGAAWPLVLPLAGGITAFVYLVFETLLRVGLHRGLLFS